MSVLLLRPRPSPSPTHWRTATWLRAVVLAALLQARRTSRRPQPVCVPYLTLNIQIRIQAATETDGQRSLRLCRMLEHHLAVRRSESHVQITHIRDRWAPCCRPERGRTCDSVCEPCIDASARAHRPANANRHAQVPHSAAPYARAVRRGHDMPQICPQCL